MTSASMLTTTVLSVAAFLSLCFTGMFLRKAFFEYASPASVVHYSYVGADYPIDYPVRFDKVAMSLHDTVRLSIDAEDEVANKEWEAFLGQPSSYGWVRMGEERRLFLLAFHHEVHCIYQLHNLLAGPNQPVPTKHTQHCLNYLRQLILCEASDTLEKGDFLQLVQARIKLGDDLVCRDWERVYDALEENYGDFLEWQANWD